MLTIGKAMKPSLTRSPWGQLRSGNRQGGRKRAEVRSLSPEEELITEAVRAECFGLGGAQCCWLQCRPLWDGLWGTERAGRRSTFNTSHSLNQFPWAAVTEHQKLGGLH